MEEAESGSCFYCGGSCKLPEALCETCKASACPVYKVVRTPTGFSESCCKCGMESVFTFCDPMGWKTESGEIDCPEYLEHLSYLGDMKRFAKKVKNRKD